MGREEQLEEREVLDSIFPDEIQDVSETEFRISILLDVTNEAGDESEPPTMLLKVTYPEAYPDEAPILDLFSPPQAPAHQHLNLVEDKDDLLAGLKDSIDENLGMAMIFALVSTLKDNAEQLIVSRQQAAQHAHEEKVLAAEREENKKFHGTPVNPETFKTWREGFRKEMEEEKERLDREEEIAEKKRNRGKEAVVLLTGKQLWERGMIGKTGDEEEDDETLGLEKLPIGP